MCERWRKDYAQTTFFTRLIDLRRLLRKIDAELGTDLVSCAPRPKKPDPRNVTITAPELTTMLSKAPLFMRLFLMLMVSLGLRFSEAMRASPENFNKERQTISLKTKGGKTRTFPVPDEIATLFNLAPDTEGTYLERIRGKGPISRDTLRNRWVKLKHDCGIRMDLIPHDLRRTAAVRVYTLTKDVLAVKALLGHDSLAATARYLTPYDPEAMHALENQLKRWTPAKGAIPQ